MADHSIWVWVLFNAFVLAMLAMDLGVFHRKHHAVGIRESLIWTAVWIIVAFAFAGVLWIWGAELDLLAEDKAGLHDETGTAVLFITAYLIEKSLSMDNIFVFLLVFRYFSIPPMYQHKALFWGILGALVMRLAFIIGGIALLKQFHWVAYIFGAILVITGIKLWKQDEAEIHPERNFVLRLFRKIMPVQSDLAGGRFAVRREGRWVATPLLVALVALETTDVLFAVDSVPAVLAVTTDEFIAYSSNVFAILGLRALYFALAGILPLFKDLHYGLSFILVFVGAKMLVAAYTDLPDWMPWASLAVVVGVLAVSMITSVIRHKDELGETAATALGMDGDRRTDE